MSIRKRLRLCAGLSLLSATLGACESLEGNITLGVVTATAVLGQAPTTEISQTYYLGVFDPQDQLPPAVYRVRVLGQASWLSQTKYASGWVHASVVDSLGSTIAFDKNTGAVRIGRPDEKELVALKTGRRLVMFGPEGFREAPADHRLVIVTGSDPEKFFEAIDNALGQVAGAISGQRGDELKGELLEALLATRSERVALSDLKAEIAAARAAEARAK